MPRDPNYDEYGRPINRSILEGVSPAMQQAQQIIQYQPQPVSQQPLYAPPTIPPPPLQQQSFAPTKEQIKASQQLPLIQPISAPPQQGTLRNPKIAESIQTSGDKPVNRAFVDALYKEVKGRYASDDEFTLYQGAKVKDVAKFVLGKEIVAPPTEVPISGNVPIGAKAPEIPMPTAQQTVTNFFGNIENSLLETRNAVENVYKRQVEEIQRPINEAQKEIARISEERKGVIESNIKPLLQPFRETLENAERQRLYITQNFEENQKLTNELGTLLSEGNALIKQQQDVTSLGAIKNPRLAQTISDVTSRAGIIQSVMAARNGQIAQAYNMVDRTVSAVTADKQDQLNYFNTILTSLNQQKDEEGKKLLTLTGKQQKYLDAQIGLLENDLSLIQKNAEALKKAMTDPDTALAYAQAGITFTDSVEQRNQKLALYGYQKEVAAQSKEMAEKGYAVLLPGQKLPAGATIIPRTDSVGNIKQYYKVPTEKELLDVESQRLQNIKTAKEIGQMGAGPGGQIELPGVGTVNASSGALAQEYVTTGKLPSASDIKAAGTNFGEIMNIAKQIPLGKGTVVSRVTGVKDSKVAAAEQEDFSRLYSITELGKELVELDKKRQKGLIATGIGFVFGAEDQARYMATRKAIIDEIARMQTGAALTESEQAYYESYLPTVSGKKGFFFGQDSAEKIKNFNHIMETNLGSRLSAKGLAIIGYTKINLGGKEYTIGDEIEVNGVRGRILPDGSISTPEKKNNISMIDIPQTSRIAYVHNNPGNLMFAGQEGAQQGEPKKGGGFWALFSSPVEGFKALVNQVLVDASRNHTISSFIAKYAPASENATNQYLSQITNMLGVNPNTKLSQVDPVEISKAIALKESSTKIS